MNNDGTYNKPPNAPVHPPGGVTGENHQRLQSVENRNIFIMGN